MSAPNKYVDGYVFYEKKSSWLNVCRLWKEGDIRFAARNYFGPDVIVAFVGELPGAGAEARRDKKLDSARAAANPSQSSAKSTLITISGPSRWSDKQRYAAHLRITAPPDKAQSIYDAFDPTGPGALFRPGQGYNGHALCDGDWQVLVELGANSDKELDELIKRARQVPGAEDAIVTKVEVTPQPPKPPDKCEPWT